MRMNINAYRLTNFVMNVFALFESRSLWLYSCCIQIIATYQYEVPFLNIEIIICLKAKITT